MVGRTAQDPSVLLSRRKYAQLYKQTMPWESPAAFFFSYPVLPLHSQKKGKKKNHYTNYATTTLIF